MVSVSQVNGSYISSSLPKVLMMPASLKSSKHTRSKVEIADSLSDCTLYSKAQSRKSKKVRHFEVPEDAGQGDECPPVSGREHVPVQTDLYLEELCDMIEEADEECQTDPLLDRPPSPLFVPAKSGIDAETQIYPGELFDFDKEVQPLLESLVGQTLEQSLIEVAAEEELKELEEKQKDYEARRNAELAERLRLEEQERRLLAERQKRLREQEEAVRLEEETAQKIAACVFAQNYLSDLLPKVYKRLEAQGYFAAHDPDVEEIEEHFWPWLLDEVSNEITTLEASCVILDSLIEDAVQNVCDNAIIRPVTPDQYPERVEEVEEKEEEEEEEKQAEDEEKPEDDSEEVAEDAE